MDPNWISAMAAVAAVVIAIYSTRIAREARASVQRIETDIRTTQIAIGGGNVGRGGDGGSVISGG